MPVIFTATFPIRVNGDGTIDILTKFKEEIRKSGCAAVAAVSERLGTTLLQAQNAARQLAGDGMVACDSDGLYCCADNERLSSFMDSMKRLRGG